MSPARFAMLLGLTGCSVVEPSVVVSDASPPVVGSRVSASPLPAVSAAPSIESAPPLPESKAKPVRIELAVKGASAACTLLLTGEIVEQPDAWFLRDVTRIEVEACEAMPAQLLFDGAQTGTGHVAPLAKIPAIFWIKPGHTLSVEAASEFAALSNGLQDLNADGHLDLCSARNESTARSEVCWLFDEAKRVFVYHPELSEIPNMRVSQGKLSGSRHNYSAHEILDYAWVGGKAELVRSSTEMLGRKPNGDEAPGRAWLVVEEFRNGKVTRRSEREVPYDP